MTDTIPTITDISLGLRLREIRTSKGCSQATLGKYLGVSFQQVQKYERGVNHLSTVRSCEIAAFFGITVADLLQQPSELTIKKNSMRLCSLYNQLPSLQQKALLNLATVMAGTAEEAAE